MAVKKVFGKTTPAIIIALFSTASAPNALGQQIKTQADFEPLATQIRALRKEEADKSIKMNIPLHSRIISFNLIAPFEPAHQMKAPGQFIMEYVREGEKVESWTELVTVLSFQGIAARARAANVDIVPQIVNNNSNCQSGFSADILERGKLLNGVEYTLSLSSCESVKVSAYKGASSKNSEQYASYHFLDANNLYSLQYAVRGEGKAGLKMNKETAKAAMQKFGTVSLCSKSDISEECVNNRIIDKVRQQQSE